MMPGLRARRRADEFNALVDSLSTQGVEERAEHRFDAHLALVDALRSAAPVEPRPDFVSRLRSELMAEADEVLTPTAARLTLRPRTATRERRLAVAVGAFAVASAATSMAAAAQGALPGDTLYPLKRAIENAETTLQFDEQNRAETMLAQAADRLAEAEALAAEGGSEEALVADTLYEFSDQAGAAADAVLDEYEVSGSEQSMERLSDFASTSQGTLDELQGSVPESARPALIEASLTIEQIGREISYLCAPCEAALAPRAATTQLDDQLLAGPAEGSEALRRAAEKAAASEPQPTTGEGGSAPGTGGGGTVTDPATDPLPTDGVPRAGRKVTENVEKTVEETTGALEGLVNSVTGNGETGNLVNDTLNSLNDTVGGVLGQ